MLVDPETEQQLEGIPTELAAFQSWGGACAGQQRVCVLQPAAANADVEATFGPLVAMQRSFRIMSTQPRPASFGSIAARLAADAGLLVALRSEPGIDVDGRFQGSQLGGQSTSVIRVESDGGVVWTSTFNEFSDAGRGLVAISRLVESGGRLLGAGVCGGVVHQCGADGPGLFELDIGTGQVRDVVRLPLPSVPLLPPRLPELPGALFGLGTTLVDASQTVRGAPMAALPFLVAGCIGLGDESIECAATWTNQWSWGGCLSTRPAGAVAGGIVRFNPLAQTCALLEELESTDPQGRALLRSYFASSPGTVMWGSFQGSFNLGSGVATPSGSSVALVRRGGGASASVWPAAPVSDSPGFPMSRGPAVMAFTGSSTTMLFGRSVQPQQALLARFDASLQLESLLPFENVTDFAVDARGGRTVLVVRGVGVSFAGRALAADASEYFHVLLLNE